MKARTVLFLSILLIVILIAAINWTAFTTPISLSLLFTTIQVPLGLSMLAVIGLLSVLYLFFVWKTQTSAFFESRRKTSEVEKARKLAANEEESRFESLRQLVEDELDGVHEKLDKLLLQLDPEGSAVVEGSDNVVEKIGDSIKKMGEKLK